MNEEEQQKVDELTWRLEVLSKVGIALIKMGDSPDYTFSLLPDEKVNGELELPAADNLFRITMHFIPGNLGNALHELKHGFQALKGDIIGGLENEKVTTNYSKKFTSLAQLNQPGYFRQYAFPGKLAPNVEPLKEELNYLNNQVQGLTGTNNQLNYVIQNSDRHQTTVDLIKRITLPNGTPIYTK
ncbi:hypothetical protein [Chitinophaga sancti]|uniref:Uncharacterized protein n=1 Tax=Chitinophaga sancti TaxID=1004 RepID=A0ABZ0XKB8_9BACT|nr:hypothetical protein [Chitinophaga sancti]WQD63626.1 hypothetical protein U0033_04405 [Chitinophaga sancti]WQG90749.1 hypothetical protein SR876_04515 [Chitinophaga sancti]